MSDAHSCVLTVLVKDDFSPQLATAPPGAGRDFHAGINQGEDDRVVAEDLFWLLGWKTGLFVKVTP